MKSLITFNKDFEGILESIPELETDHNKNWFRIRSKHQDQDVKKTYVKIKVQDHIIHNLQMSGKNSLKA